MINCMRIFVILIALLPIALNAHSNLLQLKKLVQTYSPAVVNISTTQKKAARSLEQEEFLKYFFGFIPGEPSAQSSLGSGFIVSQDGYVLTNYHVVKNSDEIMVKLNDRSEYVAQLVGFDELSDLALLKVEANRLPTVKIGDSSESWVGDWVFAIGSPFGFEHSVSQGIISAKGRRVPIGETENYMPFLQTDVAINPGNSGGPLFNLSGEVIGVNSMIYTKSGGFMGVSFAIPINDAMNIVTQLKNKGHVSRGWLGIVIQEVTSDLAKTFGLAKPKGALVVEVLEDSPAEIFGLKAGDIIVKVDNKSVTKSEELPYMIGSLSNQKALITIVRDKKVKKIKVDIGVLSSSSSQIHKGQQKKSLFNKLGLIVEDNFNKYLNEVRVEVVDIERIKSSLIQRGDYILAVKNIRLKNVKHFNEILSQLAPNQQVPLLILRGQEKSFVVLSIKEK